MGELLMDVVAVSLVTNKVRLIAESEAPRNADAIVKMAVMRRGVEEEFFADVPHGAYVEGDTWVGDKG